MDDTDGFIWVELDEVSLRRMENPVASIWLHLDSSRYEDSDAIRAWVSTANCGDVEIIRGQLNDLNHPSSLDAEGNFVPAGKGHAHGKGGPSHAHATNGKKAGAKNAKANGVTATTTDARPVVVKPGKEDNNSCLEGTLTGGVLGGALGGALAKKDNWIWSIPAGAVGGALVGCQVDGG